MNAKDAVDHRGRFQAQGGPNGGIEVSEAWAQAEPLLASDGRLVLARLKTKLSPAERIAREAGFADASLFIDRSEATGGVYGQYKKSFPNGKLRKIDPRVDVEVNCGLAFVAEQPTAAMV